MFQRTWSLLRATIEGYIADEAMSRGAAVAYYTIFSLAPLLVIATAVAGLVFGTEAVQGVVATELAGMLGTPAALAVQGLIASAAERGSGGIATLIGATVLIFTASGVFAELQAALNAIWRAAPATGGTVSTFLRARALSLGLVAATGFLLLCSLLISAGLAAIGAWAGKALPGWAFLLPVLNFAASFLVITLLFAAIYKVLPDRRLAWRDVGVGAVATAFLFTIGKSLIAWYIGAGAVASAYGATGALLVVLLWIYYSAQIFLLGAEFTRSWAEMRQHAKIVPMDAMPVRSGPRFGPLHAFAMAATLVTLVRRRRS